MVFFKSKADPQVFINETKQLGFEPVYSKMFQPPRQLKPETEYILADREGRLIYAYTENKKLHHAHLHAEIEGHVWDIQSFYNLNLTAVSPTEKLTCDLMGYDRKPSIATALTKLDFYKVEVKPKWTDANGRVLLTWSENWNRSQKQREELSKAKLEETPEWVQDMIGLKS